MKPDYERWINENEILFSEEEEKVWRHAQNTLYKRLIEELENDMDKLFGKKNSVTLDKAVLVAYIGSLMTEYRFKKTLLERFDGEMDD